MEDENGIELSLGLSCGGSAGKSKDKDGSSSDTKTDGGANNNKLMGDLKNFLTGIPKQDSDNGPQKSDMAHSGIQTRQENFFTNLAKPAPVTEASMDLHGNTSSQFTRYEGLWATNNKSAEVEEVKSDHHEIEGRLRPETGNKRKMLFEEINLQKKCEREVQHSDAHGKNHPMGVTTSVKTSNVSVTTEDGSTAENEDVADSEVEGSSSRLVLHHKDSIKLYIGGGSSSEVAKENHRFTNSSVVETQGQKQPNGPPGSESKLGNLTCGAPFPLMTAPFSLSMKVPNATGEPNVSGFPLPCVMQLMPPANNEGPGTQPTNPGSLPLTFGYSPIQLPTVDTDHSRGLISHRYQLPPTNAFRNIGSVVPYPDRSEDGFKISRVGFQAPPHCSSEVLSDERKASELEKGAGKHVTEGASSSFQTEDELKGNNVIFGLKEAYHQLAVEGLPHEGSAIRSGIAPGLKFGGSGSRPDLPWVSATGPGPNGRTISGVTYIYDKNQIRIVCACHGSHMSSEEFVQHASADPQNPENNTGLTQFPSSNPAASAQS